MKKTSRTIPIGQEENILDSLFDEEAYLDQYPDVAEVGIDPLEHYVYLGFEEEKLTQNDFSIEVSYGSGTEYFTPEMGLVRKSNCIS